MTEGDEGYVTPFFVLFNGAVAAVLVWLPYAMLIQFSMLLMNVAIIMFFVSFLILRVTHKDMERPFLVPGGALGALLVFYIRIAMRSAAGAEDVDVGLG